MIYSQGILYLNNELFLIDLEDNSSFINLDMSNIESNASILKFLMDWDFRKHSLESIYVLVNDVIHQYCIVNLIRFIYWEPQNIYFAKNLNFSVLNK